MMQLGLFDALHAPPVIMPIDPEGSVIKGEVNEVLTLPHPRLAWDRARIELHRHENGLWMWSTSWHCDMGGSGYRVGPKWGRFAETRDDALFYAVEEITRRLDSKEHSDAKHILAWVASL